MANGKSNGCDKGYKRTSRGKGKSRRETTRFNSKEARFDKEASGGKTEASNDPGWYGAESNLMRDAANLSFAQFAGMPLSLSNATTAKHYNWKNTIYRVPGIMELDVVCLPGMVGDWSEPFNVAIRDKYSFIRHMNSGHSNYDASDLGMYFLAYDAACTYYAFLCRLYGSLRTIVLRNRYLPDNVVSAMGGNYKDLVTHMAEFRYYINSFAARLSALKVPSDLTFIERHMWMFSHVFSDAPTDKAQLYVFKPAGLWTHTVDFDDQYMALNTRIPVSGAGYEVFKGFGEDLLNAVLNSEDFNIMSGDIVKAYGDRVFSLKLIPEDYTVAPVYDPEALLQIHNATILTTSEEKLLSWRLKEQTEDNSQVGSITDDGTFKVDWDITVSQSIIDAAAINNMNAAINVLLDVPLPNPGPKEVAIATRLCVRVDDSGALTQYGTEVVVNAYVITRAYDGNVVRDYFCSPINEPVEMFGSHPLFFKFAYSNNPPQGSHPLNDLTIRMGDLVGDVDNYTVVTPEVIGNIHRAALMGMFGLSK